MRPLSRLILLVAALTHVACDMDDEIGRDAGEQGPQHGEEPYILAADDIVLYASSAQIVGSNWRAESDSTAAGGTRIRIPDAGVPKQSTPSTSDYVEFTFTPRRDKDYKLWIRAKAEDDHWDNDSVFVQFSNALVDGSPAYRIGTSSGVPWTLDDCRGGPGIAGWGWQSSEPFSESCPRVLFERLRFDSSAPQTIRISSRQDGLSIDQVVLSGSTYLSSRPGALNGDGTILFPEQSADTSGGSTQSPYHGAPIEIPARIQAEEFDHGGAGIAYADSSDGNSGGAFRSEHVDLEPTDDSGGGVNVGWIAAGEWLEYTISVPAGTYEITARVAALSGGNTLSFKVDGADATDSIAVPATGAWQSWQTTSPVSIALSAGTHVLHLYTPTGGFNVNWFEITPVSSTPGSELRVLSYNVAQLDQAGVGAHADVIWAQQPHIVMLQETTYANRAAFQSALEQRSGTAWYTAGAVHAQDGTMLLTRIAPAQIEARSVGGNSWGQDRTAVKAVITFNGVTINLFGTHLDIAMDWSGGHVLENMQNLLAWANQSGMPQIIGGDLNAAGADPLQQQALSLLDQTHDDVQRTITGCDGNCQGTHDNGWRPDHIYRSKVGASRVTPVSFTRIDDAAWMSDHYPILAVFEVR